MFEMEKVAENDKAIFYVSDMSKSLTQHLKNIGLKDIFCLVAELKETGETSYILVENREVIYDNPSFEQTSCHIDMLKLVGGK